MTANDQHPMEGNSIRHYNTELHTGALVAIWQWLCLSYSSQNAVASMPKHPLEGKDLRGTMMQSYLLVSSWLYPLWIAR